MNLNPVGNKFYHTISGDKSSKSNSDPDPLTLDLAKIVKRVKKHAETCDCCRMAIAGEAKDALND